MCLPGLLAISAGRTSKYVRSGNASPSKPSLLHFRPSIHCYSARDIALIDPYSHNALLPRVPGYRITTYLIMPYVSTLALAAFVFDLLLNLAKLTDRHIRWISNSDFSLLLPSSLLTFYILSRRGVFLQRG